MKILRTVSLALVCLGLATAGALVGCSGQIAGLPIDANRLAAYTATYAADTAAGGNMEIGLSRDASGNWVVSSNLVAPTGKMQSQVNLRSDFTPGSSSVTLEAEGKTYKINSTYEDKRLVMTAETPTGPQLAERNLTRPYYDNEQLVAMLPALTLTAGQKQKFVLVATQSATKLTPTVYLATGADGKALVEQVAIPSGSVPCQVIKFSSGIAGQPEQTFWVTTSAPFVVTKINNGTLTYHLTKLK